MSNRQPKKNFLSTLSAYAAGVVAVFLSGPALANGIPEEWGLGLQSPGSPVMRHINNFHDMMLVIIGLISLFVLGLLIWVILRYNSWINPKPSRTAHNIKLEVIWTLVPCLVLLGIGFFSFPLLYYSDRMPTPDLTLKVTGHQWYWSYEYPDNNGINFDSHAIWYSSDVTQADADKQIADDQKDWLIKDKPIRLLEVDNRVVLPVGKNIRVDITGGDVEHSWFIPALAVNRMAVPGRLSELWLKVDKEGIYYGQCSMICGQGHGYMPIVIEGVSPDKFAAWVSSKKQAMNNISTPHFAAAETGNAQ